MINAINIVIKAELPATFLHHILENRVLFDDIQFTYNIDNSISVCSKSSF